MGHGDPIRSFFFPPQNTRPVVRPEDACPTETEDNRLLVNLTGGYCLLYPADFAPDPEFPVAIIGGPELGPVEGFDSLRASLAVSSYDLGDQSPEQALQPISEQIDPILGDDQHDRRLPGRDLRFHRRSLAPA